MDDGNEAAARGGVTGGFTVHTKPVLSGDARAGCPQRGALDAPRVRFSCIPSGHFDRRRDSHGASSKPSTRRATTQAQPQVSGIDHDRASRCRAGTGAHHV